MLHHHGFYQECVGPRSGQGTIHCEVFVRTLSEINQLLAAIEGELQQARRSSG